MVMFAHAWHRSVQDHQVGLAVAGKVHELSPPTAKSDGWSGRDQLEGGKLHGSVPFAIVMNQIRRTKVALVVPSSTLLGQNAGSAFTVQVGPFACGAEQSDRQVRQARWIYLLHLVLHDGPRVFKFDW